MCSGSGIMSRNKHWRLCVAVISVFLKPKKAGGGGGGGGLSGIVVIGFDL